MIFGINITRDISKLSQISRAVITYNNFKISLVVFMPNITINHAITYTNYIKLTKRQTIYANDFVNAKSQERNPFSQDKKSVVHKVLKLSQVFKNTVKNCTICGSYVILENLGANMKDQGLSENLNFRYSKETKRKFEKLL